MLPGSSIDLTLIDLLYGLCAVLLTGSAIVILWRDPRSPVHRNYALTAISLLGYLLTLFFFRRLAEPGIVLLLGRLNFAAALLAALFAFRFVRAVAGQGMATVSSLRSAWWTGETLAVSAVTAFSPLVDQVETVGKGQGGQPLTQYGWLFPLYLLHVLIYLGLATLVAFQSPAGRGKGRAANRPISASVHDQLTLIGTGILATGVVALVTNALLPYMFDDFRFVDIGVLSALLFLLAVGYATATRELFDLKRFIRKTLVYGLLLSLAMAAYSAVVVLVTDKLTQETADSFTRFTLLVIVFSVDPVRRFLEVRIDDLLFSRRRKQQVG